METLLQKILALEIATIGMVVLTTHTAATLVTTRITTQATSSATSTLIESRDGTIADLTD